MTQVLDTQRLEGFERAGRVTDGFYGNVGMTRRRAQLGVAEQHLDHLHVDVCLQQVRGKAVPQRVQSCGLGNTYQMLGRVECPTELSR